VEDVSYLFLWGVPARNKNVHCGLSSHKCITSLSFLTKLTLAGHICANLVLYLNTFIRMFHVVNPRSSRILSPPAPEWSPLARTRARKHTNTPTHIHAHAQTHMHYLLHIFIYSSWWFCHPLRKCLSSLQSVSEAAMLNVPPYCHCLVDCDSNVSANWRRLIFLFTVSFLLCCQTFLYERIGFIFYLSLWKIKYNYRDMVYN
jgi:hypothetical protein